MGEPLYTDIMTALAEMRGEEDYTFQQDPMVTGGRYGLSSKEFTPGMVKGVFDELRKDKPKNHFTIGINDDLTRTSLEYDPTFLWGTKMYSGACFTDWVPMVP